MVKKALHKVSSRLQRMLLRLQKYELTLNYVTGKYLYVADSLCRAHSDETPEEDLNSADLDAARRQLVLKAIHEGHLECKARAWSCVYWSSMNKDIEQEVQITSLSRIRTIFNG